MLIDLVRILCLCLDVDITNILRPLIKHCFDKAFDKVFTTVNCNY